MPKEDKKSCCVIFQQSVDYEKKLLSSTMLKFKAKVREGNVSYWSDWMDIVTKVRKFKVRCLHQGSILKINPYRCEDNLRDYNKKNSTKNFLQHNGNDAKQKIEEILIILKFIIFMNTLINLYFSFIWLLFRVKFYCIGITYLSSIPYLDISPIKTGFLIKLK